MSDEMVKEVTIKLRELEQLYLAPDMDPFSDLEVEMFGESAFQRIQKQLEPGFWQKSGKLRLVILLPKDKIKPGLDEKVMRAIDRSTELRTKDNNLAARNERWNGLRRLTVAVLVSLGIIAVSALLFNTLLSDLPRDIYSLLYGFLALVMWVLVWNPIDILAFEWVPYSRANQVLAYIAKAEIVIKPWE
jgi:hypothetical protein